MKRARRMFGVANEIRRSGGYFSTDEIRKRLDYFLRIKLMKHHADAGRKVTFTGPIKFKDIDPEVVPECCSLKVIVTDITNGRPIIFGTSEAHQNVEVAEAVAASISIPGVFKPAHIRSYAAAPDALYADGGLVSNLPIWVFAEEKLNFERAENPKGRVPILAFSLIADDGAPKPNGTAAVSGFWNVLAYAKQVGAAAIFGGQTVVHEFVPDLLQIAMPIRLKTTEFDFDLQRALDAYYEAYAAAARTLVQQIRVRPARVNAVLADFHRDVIAAIHQSFPQTKVQSLRVSLITRFGASSFRIVHSYNMADDADDRLVFSQRAQGAPNAFSNRAPAFIDFANTFAAGKNPYMTKYEFALVRRSLQSAICFPVFNEAQAWNQGASERPEPLGVVAIDSDSNLAHIFGDKPVMQEIAIKSLKFNEVLRA